MKAKEFIIELKKESKPRNFVAKNASLAGKAGQHKDKKKAEKQGDVKHKKELATMESALSELSTEKLAQYKKAAGADAKKADADGNYSQGDKRFKGINRATNKQFDNDLKKRGVAEALDSNFVGFMNKTLGQKADAPTDKSPMPDFMKGAPVAGLDSMGYKAALDFGMKTLRKLTPTQKTKLSIKGEDGVVNWLANQAKKQGLLITDESDEDTQGKFMQEDLDEVQDFLPEVFHDPAIKSWAFVLTDGEPLPKAPVAGPFKVGINPGITGQNGYANADWKTVDTLENLPDARDLAQGLSQKNPKQFVAIWAANGKSAGFYWPGEGWRGIDEGVAEGGEKYKVKSIGHDAKGDYYISPSTGKKVYKSGVKVGDHENPKTGEHKGVAEDMSRRGFLRGAGALAVGSALAGGASADNQTDPNKLIAIVNINGESKEFNLTGRFKGDAKSQLHQAEDFITEFLEKRDINFSNLELRYQGAVLKTQNIGSVKEEQGMAEEITADDMARSAHMQGFKIGREGSGNNMDRAKAQHGENFKHYNAGFLKGRNEKAKSLKAFGQGYNKKRPQPVAEGFNGEYDDEAGMAHTNLLTSARAVMGLLKTIDDKDNLPEWVQEKIAKAEMMLVGVWDYLQSQKEQGIDPQQDANEADERTMSRAAKGNEKYGKDGMKALAKAGREGASDKKLDTIRDKHDNYNENSDPYFESLRAQVEELAKK